MYSNAHNWNVVGWFLQWTSKLIGAVCVGENQRIKGWQFVPKTFTKQSRVLLKYAKGENSLNKLCKQKKKKKKSYPAILVLSLILALVLWTIFPKRHFFLLFYYSWSSGKDWMTSNTPYYFHFIQAYAKMEGFWDYFVILCSFQHVPTFGYIN